MILTMPNVSPWWRLPRPPRSPRLPRAPRMPRLDAMFSTLKGKIITRGGKIVTVGGKISTGCGNLYLLARTCPSGGGSTVGMTVANAAIIGSSIFSITGTPYTCYFFNFSDTPTSTAPATLVTPAGVTTFANCSACTTVPPPPETCGTCVNSCYQITGYMDGDFSLPMATYDCRNRASYVPSLPLFCNGSELVTEPAEGDFMGTPVDPYPVWSGNFLLIGSMSPDGLGNDICTWEASCDNATSGTWHDGGNRLCVSGYLLFTARLVRKCATGSGLSTKTLNVQVYDGTTVPPGNPPPIDVWTGVSSDTTPEMAVTYTRTSGASSGPSTLTVGHC